MRGIFAAILILYITILIITFAVPQDLAISYVENFLDNSGSPYHFQISRLNGLHAEYAKIFLGCSLSFCATSILSISWISRYLSILSTLKAERAPSHDALAKSWAIIPAQVLMSIGFLFPSFRRVCKDEICHVVGPSYGKFTMLVVGVAIFFAAMHAALDRRVIDKLSSLTRVKTH